MLHASSTLCTISGVRHFIVVSKSIEEIINPIMHRRYTYWVNTHNASLGSHMNSSGMAEDGFPFVKQ